MNCSCAVISFIQSCALQSDDSRRILACEQLSLPRMPLSNLIMILSPVNEPAYMWNFPNRCFKSIPQLSQLTEEEVQKIPVPSDWYRLLILVSKCVSSILCLRRSCFIYSINTLALLLFSNYIFGTRCCWVVYMYWMYVGTWHFGLYLWEARHLYSWYLQNTATHTNTI